MLSCTDSPEALDLLLRLSAEEGAEKQLSAADLWDVTRIGRSSTQVSQQEVKLTCSLLGKCALG